MKDKIVFETFRKIDAWSMGNLIKKEPSAFNGHVDIKKYRVTIEVVEESEEVLGNRLQRLWEECDNYHLHKPLMDAAKEIDYKFKGQFGSKRKTKI
jgi:hypothetical protein